MAATKQSLTPTITSRQCGGDDGYQWTIFVNGKQFVTGLTKREVPYYKEQALKQWDESHGIERLRISDAKDWDLIYRMLHFGVDRILGRFEKEWSLLYESCYGMNDAYGPIGFVPPQGYDWSGIRDSSEERQKSMADYIRKWCADRQITVLRYKRII